MVGLVGALPVLQLRVLFDNMFPEGILPLGGLFAVANDHLGGQPPIRRQQDKKGATCVPR